METPEASGSVAAGFDEDSVDIYEDLDGSNTEKSPSVGSALKDSMDLYEDIVAEEQHSRQSSYTELKSRFEAVQNQIKDLHRRLKQMEIQNTGLSSENCRLKKNISALLRTARQEVSRKDAEIQQLTQRVQEFNPRYNHHLPQIKRVQDPDSAGRTSSTCSSTRRLSPPPPPPNSQSKEDPPPTDVPCNLSRSLKPSRHGCSERQSEVAEKRTESDPPRPRDREEKRRSQKSSEFTDRRLRNDLHRTRDCEQKQAHKDGRDAGHGFDSRSHKNRKYLEDEKRCRSDGAKTTSYEHRTDEARRVSLEYDKGRSCRKIPNGHRHGRRSDSKENKSSSPEPSAKRRGDGTKEQKMSRQKDQERSEDRKREGEMRRHHRGSSSIERAKQSRTAKGWREGRCGKKAEVVRRSSEEPNPDANVFVDDNNSNRKLCFMETLNLTLSPIKRYVPPRASSPEVHQRERSAAENAPPSLDDMCIIDEIESSQLEAEPGHFEEKSTQNLNGPIEEQTGNQFNVEDVKEHAQNVNESPGKALAEVVSSPCRQPQDTAELNAAPSPQSAPSQTTVDSEQREDQLVLFSNNAITGTGQLEATERSQPADTPPSMLERHKSYKPVQTSQAEDAADDPEAADADSGEAPVPPDGMGEVRSLQLKGADDTEARARVQRAGSPSAGQQGLCVPSSTSVTQENDPVQPEPSKGLDSVSSTICLDSLPQEGPSLTEAVHVVTRTDADARPSSSVGCIGVSKVSSTTEELSTPQKVRRPEPSSSVSLFHDEDSMMHTLSNLRRIPEAISPLRSPMQTAKRSGLHVHSRLGHVKSLQKDFSTTAAETSSKKLDVNKENKHPSSPAHQEAQNVVNKVSEQTSGHLDTELEEGEILSESDEATSSSPIPATKRAKLTEPVRNKPGLPSFLRKKNEGRRVASKESPDLAAVSTLSPRTRFKTVCPTASKASFSTIEEIMETFKSVRAEMRKKYMKLHKTFPKKSFYGVMDNFQKSFLEFVDGAQFDQICSEAEELKSKLRKLIGSVFSKVLNNGIVKRIFEQQAFNLKQKLWDFVDVQVDYLFMDVQTTLKSLCQPIRAPTEDRRSSGEGLEPPQAPAKKLPCKQNKSHSPNSTLNRTKSCAVVPYRTGLGSRGKDIRMSHAEKDGTSRVHPLERKNTPALVDFLSSSPEKHANPSLLISQNGSVLDKTDFQLLTEQQASSLTFNLVRDSQMGEIFKCLLQGSDLLESTGMSGDNTAWSIGTPRKDAERLLGFATPSKFISPAKSDTSSRLIATWSSISPRKTLSPCAKNRIPLNPALFDESCLLEVPSGNKALSAEKYSILAEDLAVSLTIPSPLKSDSHLSFLQPLASTPDSVISAHISEDALLDGEDATEQDIHLALDNSSCSSKESTASETPGAASVFQPDVPMQALVMEKSNNHFIVKIRQMNVAAETTLIADETLRQTLIEQDPQHEEPGDSSHCAGLPAEGQLRVKESPGVCGSHVQEPKGTLGNNPSNQRQDASMQSEKTTPVCSLNGGSPSSHSVTVTDDGEAKFGVEVTPPKAFPFRSQRPVGSSGSVSSSREETVSESEKSLTIDTSSSAEKSQRGGEQLRKRKRRQDKLKAKRSKQEEKSLLEVSPSANGEEELSPAALSPSSLSAKNVVRKKGEVVMAWTRDEDRTILMFLKTKGASRETFSALSEKLHKPSSQIAHRFYQLMKLFKKQEKMQT